MERGPAINPWAIVLRPFSYTAAIVPVTLGAVLALDRGAFDGWLLLVTLVGSIMLQAFTNFINTYYDFRNGVDTAESPGSTGMVLVEGWLKPGQIKTAAVLALVMVMLCGTYLVILRGWPLLVLGLMGVLGGYAYTAGPVPYKYRGLGTPLVFVLMGPLMVIGSYIVQLGEFDWVSLLAAVPIGLLVAAILHANDLRDLEGDSNARVQTMTTMLGTSAAGLLYYGLVGGAYLVQLLLVLLGSLSPWTLLAWITLPVAVRLMGTVRRSQTGGGAGLQLLEPQTAQLHLQFGLLVIAGLLIDILWWSGG